jgi:carbamoyl-phosphate synthase large subunit
MNVLITGIGGDIAQSVAKLARIARPDCRLIGTDITDEHAGALFVDETRVVPRADDPRYVESIVELIESQRIDCAIPMSEPELSVLLPLIEAQRCTHWMTAGPRTIRTGIDKLETMRALHSLGIAVPWTIPAGEGEPRTLPCILKNRRGSGSRAVFTVHDAEEAKYLAARHRDAVFQELLPDAEREVTCAVYRTRDHRVATLQLRRRLAGGFTGWAVVIDDPVVAALCSDVANAFDLTGAMNVQLRLTERGPRVFEINPRYSSTALMRHEIGFSDVVWAFDELQGRRVTFPSIAEGTVVARVQGAAVIRRGTNSRVNT